MNKILLSAIIALALNASELPSFAQDSEPSPLIGKTAPAVKLDLLNGNKFDLAALKDKNVVLLDFWATWCGPCRMAMPTLVEVAKEYKDKGVQYYAINLREDPATIKEYLKKANLEIQVPLDKDGKVAERYQVQGIPTMVLVDKLGKVKNVHVGYSPELKTQIKKTLDEILAN